MNALGLGGRRVRARSRRVVGTPRLVITLPLEGAPHVYLDCLSEGDERRLRAWIASRPELSDLAGRASRIGRAWRAA